MTVTVAASEAKARLSEWLSRVAFGDSVLITRHGKPVAALVSPEDFSQIQRLRAAGPESGLLSIAGGWEGSEELLESLATIRRSPSREVPDLDAG